MAKSPNINLILSKDIACSSRGSSMGRRCVNTPPESPLYLQRVKLDNGGYDRGGAYWGAPSNLWCAFDKDGNYYGFTRAMNRTIAKEKFPITIRPYFHR